jgi:hypothetical protein
MDISFITTRLAVSGSHGLVTPLDADTMLQAGITHAINLRSSPEPYLIESKIKVLENGTVDDHAPKTRDWFYRSIQFALLTLMRPKTKLVCNCFLGQDRSPAVALAILLAQGWPEDEAQNQVLVHRSNAKVTYFQDAIRAVHELGYV